MPNDKLQTAIDTAFEIDKLIADLNQQIGVLVGDLQGQKRLHESGLLIGAQHNLKDSFFRILGGRMQDMQRDS